MGIENTASSNWEMPEEWRKAAETGKEAFEESLLDGEIAAPLWTYGPADTPPPPAYTMQYEQLPTDELPNDSSVFLTDGSYIGVHRPEPSEPPAPPCPFTEFKALFELDHDPGTLADQKAAGALFSMEIDEILHNAPMSPKGRVWYGGEADVRVMVQNHEGAGMSMGYLKLVTIESGRVTDPSAEYQLGNDGIVRRTVHYLPPSGYRAYDLPAEHNSHPKDMARMSAEEIRTYIMAIKEGIDRVTVVQQAAETFGIHKLPVGYNEAVHLLELIRSHQR